MDATIIPFQEALAGQYSIQRELGRGGMGVVYLAREVHLNRLVAIKVLPQLLAAGEDIRDRFLTEARTAAGMSHPNIVPIHRVGEAAGLPYFVMTYLDGGTLGDRLRDRGPVQSAMMTRILRDVAQALAYAHQRGIVHRDIKPDNILLDQESGRALVTDSGIASVSSDTPTDAPIAGTPQFMSPEQVLGAAVDGRSDLFSLGIVSYLALTGILPHDDADIGTLMLRRIGEDVPHVATLSAEVPHSLAEAITRCVERDPARRFANAEALVAAVESPTVVARSVLPLPLRTWAGQTVPLLPLYGLWSMGMLTSAAISMANGRWTEIAQALLMTSAPILPIMVFQFRKTARALRAGYTLADLRLALRSWRAERLEELSLEAPTPDPLWAHALRLLAPTGIVASVVAGSVVFAILKGGWSGQWFAGIKVLMSLNQWGAAVGMLSVVILTALGAPILPPALQGRWLGRGRSWLWNSSLGEWLAKRIAPADRALAVGDFRPTEMALSVAGRLIRGAPLGVQRQPGGAADHRRSTRRARRHVARRRGSAVGADRVRWLRRAGVHRGADPWDANSNGGGRECPGAHPSGSAPSARGSQRPPPPHHRARRRTRDRGRCRSADASAACGCGSGPVTRVRRPNTHPGLAIHSHPGLSRT